MLVNNAGIFSAFRLAIRPLLALVAAAALFGCDGGKAAEGSGKTKTRITAQDDDTAATSATKTSITRAGRTGGAAAGTSRAEPAASTTSDDSALTQPLVSVSGTVKFEDGAVVTTGTIKLLSYVFNGFNSYEQKESDPASINADGSYKIEGPDSQSVSLTAEGDFPKTYESVTRQDKPTVPKRRKVTKDITIVRGVEVRGQVVDEKNLPVAGASVFITTRMDKNVGRTSRSDAKTSSAAAGEFVFPFVRPGNSSVVATHPELANGKEETSVPTTAPLVVRMLRGGATITGHVYRHETRSPQPGVTVMVSDKETFQPKMAESQADGSFRVEHIRPGSSFISIKAGDKTLAQFPSTDSMVAKELKLLDNSTTDVMLLVYGGHTISGNVFDRETMEPLAGAAIAGANGQTSVTSTSDGAYRLTPVFMHSEGSNVGLRAALEGYVAADTERHQQGQINVRLNTENLTAVQDIPMAKTVTVSGQVKTADGVPVPGATVQFKTSGGSSSQQENVRQTAADGTYKLECRPFYDAVVKAEAQGFATGYSEPFHVDNADIEDVDVTIEVGATVQGTVIDPDGKLVEKASVSASSMIWIGNTGSSDSHDTNITSADGSFQLSNLPRSVSLSASHDDYASAEQEELTLTPGETRAGVVLQLKTSHNITGKVVDERDQPIAGTYVYANSSSGGGHSGNQTDDKGAFELKKLVEGTYTVRTSGHGGQATAENVKTGTTDLVLRINSEGEKDKAQLIGTVVDSETNEPVKSFTVNNLGNAKMDPGRPGGFTVSGMSQGATYNAEIASPGYSKTNVSVSVPTGKATFEQTFKLGKGGAITGTVVEFGTLKPVAGVLVVNWGGADDEYQRREAMPVSTSTTDADGKFTLAPAPAGKNLLVIRPQLPLAEVARTVDVKENDITDAGEIVLGQSGAIFGTITRGASKEPMPDASVTINGWDQNTGSGSVRKTATTAADGTYRIEGLPPRSYSVQVSKFSVTESTELKMGEEKQVDLNLGGVKVYGAVTRGGEPVRGSVSASKEGARASSSSQDGAYEMSGLTPGEWTFSIYEYSSGSGRPHEETVTVPDVEEFEKNFELPNIKITGTVVDATGDPVPGASVTLSQTETSGGGNDSWRGGFNTAKTTDQAGRFEFAGMKEGTYQVAARKKDVGVGLEPSVAVRDGAPTDVRIELKNDGGTLVSVALNMGTGTGLPEAWCYIFGPSGRLTHDSVRDASGVMTISNIPPGKYTTNVSAWSFSQSDKEVEIKAGETVTIEDVLYAAGALEWTLKKADGTAANGTAVITPLDPGSIEAPKNAGISNGVILVRGLAPGQYQVTAQATGKPAVTETFQVVAAEIARKATTVPTW